MIFITKDEEKLANRIIISSKAGQKEVLTLVLDLKEVLWGRVVSWEKNDELKDQHKAPNEMGQHGEKEQEEHGHKTKMDIAFLYLFLSLMKQLILFWVKVAASGTASSHL